MNKIADQKEANKKDFINDNDAPNDFNNCKINRLGFILVIVFIITIIIAIIVSIISIIDHNKSNKETIYDTFIDEHVEWYRVYNESYAIIRIINITNETKEWSNIKNTDAIVYYKCGCQIIYNQYKIKGQDSLKNEDDSLGYFYAPKDFVDEFVPGDTVLFNAAGIWRDDRLCLVPIVDSNDRPEYQRIINNNLELFDGWEKSRSFEKIGIVNDCIDMMYKQGNVPKWGKDIPKIKFESGMSLDETIDYLIALRAAAYKYSITISEEKK